MRGLAALLVLTALGTVMVIAPLLPLDDPADVDLVNSYAPPSVDHPLGTDSSGRDILARLVWGSRTALLGPLAVTTLATAAGVLLAVAAAWRGGWFDAVVSRAFDIVFGFPGILLALVVAAVAGAGLRAAVVAIAVAFPPMSAGSRAGWPSSSSSCPMWTRSGCRASPRSPSAPVTSSPTSPP
jgi:peptide/nickel transport system permease protein